MQQRAAIDCQQPGWPQSHFSSDTPFAVWHPWQTPYLVYDAIDQPAERSRSAISACRCNADGALEKCSTTPPLTSQWGSVTTLKPPSAALVMPQVSRRLRM